MNKLKIEFKIWAIYLATIVLSCFVHEIGHCVPAWIKKQLQ